MISLGNPALSTSKAIFFLFFFCVWISYKKQRQFLIHLNNTKQVALKRMPTVKAGVKICAYSPLKTNFLLLGVSSSIYWSNWKKWQVVRCLLSTRNTETKGYSSEVRISKLESLFPYPDLSAMNCTRKASYKGQNNSFEMCCYAGKLGEKRTTDCH